MKKLNLQKIIREEIEKALNEGPPVMGLAKLYTTRNPSIRAAAKKLDVALNTITTGKEISELRNLQDLIVDLIDEIEADPKSNKYDL